MKNQCISVFLFVIFWELSFYFFPDALTLFPAPTRLVRYLINQEFSLGLGPDQQGITSAVLASTLRVVFGLLFSLLAALLTGICI